MTTLPDLWETKIVPIQNREILTVSTRNSLEVLTQILDPTFKSIESETVFNDSDLAGVSLYPDAAKLDSGGYIVVWGAVLIPQLTFGQLMTNDLNNVDNVFKIGEQSHSQLRPRVVATPGGFVVVWGYRDDIGTGVAFQMFNEEAQPVGEEKVVVEISRAKLSAASFTYTTGIVPSIAVSLDRNEFVVVWQIEKFIQGRTYTKTGEVETDVFEITGKAESARTLSVCAMPGEYLVSWSSNGAALVQGFDSRGTLTSGETTVSQKQSDANTAVVCIPEVGFAVSFLSSAGLKEADKGIYIRFFDEHYRRKTVDLLIGNTYSFGDHSSSLNSEGEVVTVWDSHVSEPTHPFSRIVNLTVPIERPRRANRNVALDANAVVPNWIYGFLVFCILFIASAKNFCCSSKVGGNNKNYSKV